VFVLFFVLIIIGLLQLKDRNISLQRVTILPVMMVFLSFYGVISVFGLNVKSSLLWLIGLIIATFIYGILSGLFLGRIFVLLKLRK